MAVLWIALLTAACSVAPGVSSIPNSSAPTSPATADPGTPAPVIEPSPQASKGVIDPPISYSPDHMWGFLSTSAGTPSGARSLQDAAALADVVIVGHFKGIERGGGYGAPGEGVGWYATALIEIESTLKGKPEVDDGGLLRVPFLMVLEAPTVADSAYPDKAFEDLSRSIPDDPALLFLRTWKNYFDRAGTEPPSWLADLYRSDLYRTIGADGAVKVVNGILEPSQYSETWDSSLKGQAVPELGL